jgi:(p)ppGpp synthase/HD superfamily hydrolase
MSMNSSSEEKDPRMLGGRFQDALIYATQLHCKQARKGSEIPYVSHLLSAAALIIEDRGDEDEVIAALLHDAVEDQGGASRLAEIRQRFGEQVAEIVDGCSDTYECPKPPWRERKERHLEHLRIASHSVRRVVLADTLHNARATLADLRMGGSAVWSRFSVGREETIWYYNAKLAVFEARNPGWMTEELRASVGELERLGAGH